VTDQSSPWEERDELHRLDSVAGVVAASAIAGCIASAALIATGKPVYSARLVLGLTALFLLGCAVLATLSLAWSPMQALQDGKDLQGVIATKGSRTRTALVVLVFAYLVGFGTAAVVEVATDGSHDGGPKKHAIHSKSTDSSGSEVG
jgi:hypothetical protein